MQALTPMRARLLRLALCLALLAHAALSGAAERPRFALVIGNSQYGGERDLPNAANDARLIAKTLGRLGFTVTEHYNLGRDRFAVAVGDFAASLPDGATAFVYYAGHGMQLGGSNYLTPVDMPVTSEKSAAVRSYALGTLLERIARSKASINVVVLDACRNNPFQPQGATRYRSLRNLGLTGIDAPRGTLIAYSTAPGELAPDGRGSNSLYTATLARLLEQPGRELEAVFRDVGNEVRRLTRDDQRPWYESSLAGTHTLGPNGSASMLAGTRTAPGGLARDPATGRMRGAPGAAAPAPWYRHMNATEWSQLDWEIQQRVRRLTPDELPVLQRQAAGGSVVAQTVLGVAYRDGVEAARVAGSQQVLRFKANNTLAWKWLRKAAEAGFPIAQAEIGEMYYQGHGVPRSLGKSRDWLARAAAANYPRAKLSMVQVQAEIAPGEVEIGDAAKAVLESLGASRPAR